MSPWLSAVWLEVGLPRRPKFLLCNAYREWGYPNQQDKASHSINAQKERWTMFLDKWEDGIKEGKEIIVLGDINICHIKWTQLDLPKTSMTAKLLPLRNELFDRIIPEGFCQLVHGQSFIRQGQEKSGLDHLYSNRVNKLSEVALHTNAGSDHKMMHVIRYSKSISRNVRYVKKRVFKDFNEDGFRADVKLISWWPHVYSCNNPTQAAQNLSRELSKALDRWAPVKKVQIRQNYRPWISKETKVLMNQRNYAQEVASSTNVADDWRKFKHLRNTVVTRSRIEKDNWEKEQLDHLVNDPSNLWRNLKSWMGWKSSGPPSQLFVEKIILKPREIANTMNQYFVSKVKNLQKKLPRRKNDPLQYLKSAMKNRKCSFKLRAVEQDEVRVFIKNLKNSKSTGLDYMDTRTLKLVMEEILPAITHVINLSIQHQEFPDCYKRSKIIPLIKKSDDDPLNPKSYRPVSLLPILSKILERAVFVQIEEYIEKNKLLHPSHHGGRAHHSTTTAIIEMHDQWVEAVDKGDMVGCMMLDLSAAYDLANHSLILDKLRMYGFEDSAVGWMRSYLCGRSQCVYIDGELSDVLEVDVGVPQGSVLGGLLYVLLVGDLPQVVHENHEESEYNQDCESRYNKSCQECGGLTAFVDDSTYSVASADPKLLSDKLSNQYRKLADYMSDSGLVINDDETHLVVMGTRKNTEARKTVKVETGTVTIKPVETEKLLGLHIHESLKFAEHCRDNKKSLFSQLNPRMNGLRKLSRNATFKTRLMVANSTIMSLFTYMITVWGGTEGYIIRAAQVIQNRAARLVTKKGWFTSQKTLLADTNWLSIRQLIFFHTILQIWRVRKHDRPEYISEIFNPDYDQRTRLTRAGNLRIPDRESGLAKKGIRVRGACMWNSLPAELKGFEGKVHLFKKQFKTWIKANVEM